MELKGKMIRKEAILMVKKVSNQQPSISPTLESWHVVMPMK
jgi:hypothetical protein